MKLSARNRLPGRVTGISRGEAIANVELEASASSPRVTVEAVEDPCPKDPQINVRQASDRYAMPEAAALVHSNATPGVWELVD